jgi:hypothetical protein
MDDQGGQAGGPNLMQQDRDDNEVSLVYVQQQIHDLNTRLEQAGAAGVGSNPADEQLKVELQSLRDRLTKPTFFKEMNTAFREPLQREFMTRVYPELQHRFKFNNRHASESANFDRHLQTCLLEMLSARQFYTELGFLAFFKRNFFRLFAGVACTYFEAEFALTIASSIINNALFTATLGYVPDMSTIIHALNNAYQSCNQENIITFLTSLGITPESAPQIYEKIKDFSKEQIKFVLKCLFLKRVVGGITGAERPNVAQQPQRPLPTFFQMISNPSDLLAYLRSIGPSGVTGIAGAPNLSLPRRAITSFREYMDSVYPGITAQLNIVFPDTADDEIKMILFKLLLNLNDDSTEQDIEIKLALLQQRLYRCIEDKYMKTNGMTTENFHKLCIKVCPGLVGGLTQDIVERIYGPSIIETQGTNFAVSGEGSLQSHLSDADLHESTVSRAMDTLREFPSTLVEYARNWFGGWFPQIVTKSGEINKKTSIRGHATLEFIRACDAIKRKNSRNKEYVHSIDTVLNAFKNTVHYDEKGNLKVSEETDYEIELQNFNKCMDFLNTIKTSPEKAKEILVILRKFQNAAWEQYSGYCELLSSMSVPFGGNSLAMLTATETVIERMNDTLKRMIVSSANVVADIDGDGSFDREAAARRSSMAFAFAGLASGAQGGLPGAQGGLPGAQGSFSGGRSRSRKRSVSKRTRRKGVAKKQNSKKNKRQSRRKVRRASSRKGRK